MELSRFHQLTSVLLLGCAVVLTAPPTRAEDAEKLIAVQAARAELEEVVSVLNDPQSADRPGAVTQLVNLSSSDLIPSKEIESWMRWAAADPDPKVASQAQAWLDNAERRVLGLPRPWTPEREKAFAETLAEIAVAQSGTDAHLRYEALVMLLEIARSEGKCADSRVWELFRHSLDDPEPKVRSYANFAVNGGLEGEKNALHQVWVAPPAKTE